MTDHPIISWVEAGETHFARWRSENGSPAPKRVLVADDSISADTAYHLACEGTAMLWRGDFHNAKQLLQAMARRGERKPRKSKPPKLPASPAEAFHLHRQAQAQRARMLAMLLIPINNDYSIPLKRAPDLRQACLEAYGPANTESSVASLRELLGLIGAHEWRKKGVEIAALGDRIYPHYGVFSPIRGEYVQLVADAPLPSLEQAFDIGTGTGVLAAVLARRGVKRIIATDQDKRALACAGDNLARLGFKQVELIQADLFPEGKAPLVVCNPPWLPARPSSPVEYAIYDPESRMLRGFLAGLAGHLEPQGEGWLILSDFAEHLGLRTREALLTMIAEAGLKVVGKMDIKPQHPRASDPDDPLHAARSAELTSLWRLSAT